MPLEALHVEVEIAHNISVNLKISLPGFSVLVIVSEGRYCIWIARTFNLKIFVVILNYCISE